MAMVLLALLLFASSRRQGLFYLAIVLQLVTMTVPSVYRPVAVLWLGIGDLLGAVVSKVLMSVVFLIVVTPIAFVRRLMGSDPMKLRLFKAGSGSVMVERNRQITASDLVKPY